MSQRSQVKPPWTRPEAEQNRPPTSIEASDPVIAQTPSDW